jgi:hypothetical protein
VGRQPERLQQSGQGRNPAQGMAGLNEATGALFTNSQGTSGFYTRARGEAPTTC